METKILIVDDDEMVVFLHKIILKECGYTNEPLIALNGKNALEVIMDNPTYQFLVFLDLNMPILNGWKFLDALEGNSLDEKKVKVVIVTSSIDYKDKSRSSRYVNVIDFVEKPLKYKDCKELKQKIDGIS